MRATATLWQAAPTPLITVARGRVNVNADRQVRPCQKEGSYQSARWPDDTASNVVPKTITLLADGYIATHTRQ